MNWEAIINNPGFIMSVSIVSATWYFIKREVSHKKTARFNIALSKIYTQLERFIVAANKVKVNINTMPSEFLKEKKSKDLDEWITYTIYEMENMSLLTEMFFESKDRGRFKKIINAAIVFKSELHKAYSETKDNTKESILDAARRNFNKEYDKSMNDLVDMINKRLLGQWEYDLTGVRLPKLRCTRAKYKKHQQQ